MNLSQQASVRNIVRVAERLGPLRDHVVFLGGAVTGLLLTDPAAPEMRFTEDVDVVVATHSRSGYYRWEEELQIRGFRQRRVPNDPICRWVVADIVVDVMPTDEQILGFGNQWYTPALETAQRIALPGIGEEGRIEVRVITAPYFLATKIEAFRNRGSGDFLLSRDIQDIVAVVDGRQEVMAEVANAEQSLRQFLSRAFQDFLADAEFLEALSGHLLPDAASQQRIILVRDRMAQIAAISA